MPAIRRDPDAIFFAAQRDDVVSVPRLPRVHTTSLRPQARPARDRDIREGGMDGKMGKIRPNVGFRHWGCGARVDGASPAPWAVGGGCTAPTVASSSEAIRQRTYGLQEKAEGEGREIAGFEPAPRAEPADHLGLEETDDGFGQGTAPCSPGSRGRAGKAPACRSPPGGPPCRGRRRGGPSPTSAGRRCSGRP